FALLLNASHGYKHVIMMHGMLSSSSEFNSLKQMLQKDHPGTTCTLIDVFENTKSLWPMWIQTYVIGQQMQTIMDQHPEGVHLLCYSQG
ncbi:Lysosomal thioesterase PPT2, partial [Lamellibrachia satsuma]